MFLSKGKTLAQMNCLNVSCFESLTYCRTCVLGENWMWLWDLSSIFDVQVRYFDPELRIYGIL